MNYLTISFQNEYVYVTRQDMTQISEKIPQGITVSAKAMDMSEVEFLNALLEKEILVSNFFPRLISYLQQHQDVKLIIEPVTSRPKDRSDRHSFSLAQNQDDSSLGCLR